MWKYFTDLFDYLPLTALIDGQVRISVLSQFDDVKYLELSHTLYHIYPTLLGLLTRTRAQDRVQCAYLPRLI